MQAKNKELFRLSRIRIQEMRTLRDCELVFESPAGPGQWTILLGNNGCGKTTLLRSLALGLATQRAAQSVLERSISYGTLINRGSVLRAQSLEGPSALRQASIEIEANGLSFGYRLESSGSTDFLIPTNAGESPMPFLASYGSQRGNAISNRNTTSEFLEIDTVEGLFSTDSKLIDVSHWLIRTQLSALQSKGGQAEAFYDAVIATLKNLLPDVEAIETTGSGVEVTQRGIATPLSALSDGYLTTAGWLLDMVARWANINPDAEGDFASQMTGVVLIDEIDLHLHPEWQQEIITVLRQSFPQLSFVVTTHSPLTVRGAQPGEVFVLEKDEESGSTNVRQRDPVPGKIDALLTSDLFGLATTLDHTSKEMLDQHIQNVREGQPDEDLARSLRQRINTQTGASVERVAFEVAADVTEEDLAERPQETIDLAKRRAQDILTKGAL